MATMISHFHLTYEVSFILFRDENDVSLNEKIVY